MIPDPAPARVEPFMPLLVAFYFALGGLAAALVWGLGLPWPRWSADPAGLGLAAASGLVIVGVSRAMVRRLASAQVLAADLSRMLAGMGPADVLAATILSAGFEELFFRGVLLPWLGVVASTSIFAALHFPYRAEAWLWTAFALVVGAWLAWLSLWSGGLAAPILCHGIVNGANLAWLARGGFEAEG